MAKKYQGLGYYLGHIKMSAPTSIIIQLYIIGNRSTRSSGDVNPGVVLTIDKDRYARVFKQANIWSDRLSYEPESECLSLSGDFDFLDSNLQIIKNIVFAANKAYSDELIQEYETEVYRTTIHESRQNFV